MPRVQDIYDRLWDESSGPLARGICDIDSRIDAPDDTRRGISVILRLEEHAGEALAGFLSRVRESEPEQYYYPASDRHVTVLTIISCVEDFRPEDIDRDAYATILRDATDGLGPIVLRFTGVTATSSCIMLQGFPVGDALSLLRERLRRNFGESPLRHSIDSRYRREAAHCTLLRFRKPLREPARLVGLLADHRDEDFGTLRADGVDLVGTDWYLRRTHTTILSRIDLCQGEQE